MTETVEWAILCADGSEHFGGGFTVPQHRTDRALRLADAHWRTGRHTVCGGLPHVIASRRRIVTDWQPEGEQS